LEINEYVTLSSSRLVGEMLKDLDMPEDTLIGAVVQGGKVHIPRGDFIIRPGDTVITIARPEAAEELDDAFASQTRRP
jgi:trk system potassium uptake protein TrkA